MGRVEFLETNLAAMSSIGMMLFCQMVIFIAGQKRTKTDFSLLLYFFAQLFQLVFMICVFLAQRCKECFVPLHNELALFDSSHLLKSHRRLYANLGQASNVEALPSFPVLVASKAGFRLEHWR